MADGERVSGVYRRSVILVSARFAMLDDGMGFSLVPWKPVKKQRLGQTMTAVVRGNSDSWDSDANVASLSVKFDPLTVANLVRGR